MRLHRPQACFKLEDNITMRERQTEGALPFAKHHNQPTKISSFVCGMHRHNYESSWLIKTQHHLQCKMTCRMTGLSLNYPLHLSLTHREHRQGQGVMSCDWIHSDDRDLCATTMFFVSLNNVVVIFCWYYHHYFMDSWLFDLVTLQSFKFKLFFVSFPFPVFLMCVFDVHFQFVH